VAGLLANVSGVKPTFTAGGRGYGVEHVLQAAEFRGELQPLLRAWNPVRLAVAAAQAQGREPEQEALDQLAAEFRYAHNWVSADECEQGLDALGVTSDEFADHFVRCALAGPGGLFAGAAPPDASAPDSGVMDAEAARSFRIDLLLSGAFPAMARAIAWRVALQCEGRPAPDAGAVAAQKAHGLENQRLTAMDWLAPGEAVAGWLEELAVLEALFRTESRVFLNPRNQGRALADMRLQLVRLELEVLELETETAAREAFLCASEDGVTLAELAAQSGHLLRRMARFLEDLPPDWQQALMSAAPGQTLRPFADGGGYQLCHLVAKRDPALSDAEVQARVNGSLLRAHFQELENHHIQWHINLKAE